MIKNGGSTSTTAGALPQKKAQVLFIELFFTPGSYSSIMEPKAGRSILWRKKIETGGIFR